MSPRLQFLSAVVALAVCWPSGASAQATDRMLVTVDLVRTCTIAIADLDLHEVDDARGRNGDLPVDIACPDRAPFDLSISLGGSGSDRLREALRRYRENGVFEVRPEDLPAGDGPLLISVHL